MDLRGYLTGPIDAKCAFTSETDLLRIIKPIHSTASRMTSRSPTAV